ncbi:alpha-hydroxy-acid oxidizing protein [Gluconacetobacter azotocaptans]|uniref:Alpha-hydroxy-acid oxidizing protein n=1 Tax=Gluconacetobacter azotocaptans TaxID=142834 RepID=A0A7W4JV23_9PROT|nr:alpha-hydroxy acid oxidase [Gluconacetobacter azotocaptans]MBB2191433.1 alpha-hydroxy-acid oxidizing protein [Gluconacetobacter azotocaptans]GBQ29676.1 FMN-dependent L-lactate dehydrogenase [Gluconacetobacter azotocaptans DSM 13594]
MPSLLNYDDYRARAKSVLPRGLFEYIDRGTEDENALRYLRQSFDRVMLMPSVLAGAPVVDLSTPLFGHTSALPIAIAPTALAGMVWHDGETELARAAARCGIPFCVATQSITTIERIRAGAPDADLWFQLYVWNDVSLSYALIRRAGASGVRTLVVTADTPVPLNREYNARNGFTVPFRCSVPGMLDLARHPRWVARVLLPLLATSGVPRYGHYPSGLEGNVMRASASAVGLKRSLDWQDIAELRKRWDGELIVKGIVNVDDARRAAQLGVDGLVVSVHGGRNLDPQPGPIDVLPRIAEAVGGRMTIMADSGVRRGTDILKYLALGARMVLVGRAGLYGLASGGETGAVAMIGMLRNEMETAMALLGKGRPADIRLFSAS